MAHLIAILIAAAAQEPRHGFHASAGTGFGTAYDVTGVRGEIGTDHLALFAGTGAMSRLVIDGTSPGASVCFGARWYSGVARAWFTSLDVTYSWAESYVNAGIQGPGAPTGPDRLLTTGATEGYRFLFSDLVFFEVGAGVGWYRRELPPRSTLVAVRAALVAPGPFPLSRPITRGWFPDAVVGFGFYY